MPEDLRTMGFLKMLDELHARHLVGVDGVREVWLIRHADAYAALGPLAEGRIDPPLSERGLAQAGLLAARLASIPIQAVWSSELRRAQETAEAIARGRSLAVRLDERLREVRTYWDDGVQLAPVPPGSYPFPEPEADVVERMSAVVAEAAAGLEEVPVGPPRAAAVTHNAAIAIYLGSVMGLRWGQLRLMPQFTSISVVAVKGEQVVIQSIADATHLAALPSQPQP
jgi:probable phosphoglycerate mutase